MSLYKYYVVHWCWKRKKRFQSQKESLFKQCVVICCPATIKLNSAGFFLIFWCVFVPEFIKLNCKYIHFKKALTRHNFSHKTIKVMHVYCIICHKFIMKLRRKRQQQKKKHDKRNESCKKWQWNPEYWRSCCYQHRMPLPRFLCKWTHPNDFSAHCAFSVIFSIYLERIEESHRHRQTHANLTQIHPTNTIVTDTHTHKSNCANIDTHTNDSNTSGNPSGFFFIWEQKFICAQNCTILIELLQWRGC